MRAKLTGGDIRASCSLSEVGCEGLVEPDFGGDGGPRLEGDWRPEFPGEPDEPDGVV